MYPVSFPSPSPPPLSDWVFDNSCMGFNELNLTQTNMATETESTMSGGKIAGSLHMQTKPTQRSNVGHTQGGFILGACTPISRAKSLRKT